MQKTFFFILLALFLAHLFFRIFSFRTDYFTSFNPIYWENRYNQSQWVVVNSKNPIGDDGLFSYAAWKYIHGESPASIVPEYPPLGKYLLGISILLFGNQNIFALIVGLLVLIVFYLFNLEIFGKNKLYALLPVFLFSIEPLFYQQLKAPYFDLLYLLFLLLTFLFFFKNKYFLSVVFLGCFAAIKFPSILTIIIASMIFYLGLSKNYIAVKKYLLVLPVTFFIYLLVYFKYFLLGNNLLDFLKLQKWIVNFYLVGAKGEIFSIFPLLILGIWNTWWAGDIIINEWLILWPIIFAASLFLAVKLILAKDFSNKLFFHVIWIILFLLFMSAFPVWPRYLLLILPFMYNLFIWFLLKNILKKSFSF